MDLPSREQAFTLLQTHVKDNYQILHSKMVARAMEAYADKYDQENKELWYHTGLLHDLDFYAWPEGHPDDAKYRELTENKYPEDFYTAIQGHAIYRNIPRETSMAKVLLAVDEMAGLFYAVAKMRPQGFDMEVKSVKKKYKDKAFAAKIDRTDIDTGLSELGMILDDHIAFLIPIFKEFQGEL